MNPPAWILFDVGWTLVDETESHLDRFARVLAGNPAPGLTPTELFRRYEEGFLRRRPDPFIDAIALAGFGPGDRGRFPFDHAQERVYPDAVPALTRLSSRFRLGVLANQSPGLPSRLEKYGLARFFEIILGSGDTGASEARHAQRCVAPGARKPEREFFDLAVAKTACSPTGLMMVGDRPDNDIGPAKAAGWQTVRILRGPHRRVAPAGKGETADLEVAGLADLAATFDR